MNRREMIVAAAAAAAAGWVPPASAQAALPADTLAQVVRLILPEDDLTKDAAALGVPEEILASIQGHELLTRLFGAGLGWLDSAFGARFVDLTQAQQVQILTSAAQSDYNQGPGRFFYVVRYMTMQFFYGGDQGPVGLTMNDAPQPNGYAPPWI